MRLLAILINACMAYASVVPRTNTLEKKQLQQLPGSAEDSLRLVLLGPPASGKGTQGVELKDKYGLAHLATGDMLRAAIAQETPLGIEAKKHIDQGHLVPDDLVISIVKEAISQKECQKGFILDGFPRTTNQAKTLDEMLHRQNMDLTAVIDFQIEDALLIKRVLGRLVHPPSGRSYHTEFKPPKVEMTDDETGEPLVRRTDDTEEALVKRLEAYHEMTAPISEYYAQTGILHPIDASLPADKVWELILQAIEIAKNAEHS